MTAAVEQANVLAEMKETKLYREVCEAYEFAESIGEIRFRNNEARTAYESAFEHAYTGMQRLADYFELSYSLVLEDVRHEMAVEV